jgi:hypothetical protein
MKFNLSNKMRGIGGHFSVVRDGMLSIGEGMADIMSSVFGAPSITLKQFSTSSDPVEDFGKVGEYFDSVFNDLDAAFSKTVVEVNMESSRAYREELAKVLKAHREAANAVFDAASKYHRPSPKDDSTK